MQRDPGPPVNLLSPAQLRVLARMRALRPHAQVTWQGDGSSWLVEVVDEDAAPPRVLLSARFHRDGSITALRSVVVSHG